MEYKMNTAKLYSEQGWKQNVIAEILGVSDRTIRNYLTRQSSPRKERKSLLDPFKSIIKSILEENPNFNALVLLDNLKTAGYQGQISILRDHMRKTKNELHQEAVIRFETIPGFQAQVDWMELGKVRINGRRRKRYAFVMVLGYSRKAFVCFTESMKMSVVLACHVAAFAYFGGVPREILYDNMKTAFVYNADEGKFQPNKKLLQLASHYGFMPRRCRVRRPQTKGKVERFIRYIRSSFLPRNPDISVSLDELDARMLAWLDYVNEKPLRDFGQTRTERFIVDAEALRPLPAVPFDAREVHELVVHRDTTIVFEGNKYSVPPEYLRQLITLKADTRMRTAAVYYKDRLIREFQLKTAGSHAKKLFPEDMAALRRIWEKQQAKRIRQEAAARHKKAVKEQDVDVEISPPSLYDMLTITGGVV